MCKWYETHMDTQFEMDTTKAVPTPRFEVGEKFAAAQLLQSHALVVHIVAIAKNVHDKREHAEQSTDNQEHREVRRAGGRLRTDREDQVPDECNGGGEGNVPSSVAGAVTVECLANDEEPANYVGCDSKALRVDGAESKLFDELKGGG